MARTPPKTLGPKSTKDFDNKSGRYSIDEPQNKASKKASKIGFDRKIKLFMDKP